MFWNSILRSDWRLDSRDFYWFVIDTWKIDETWVFIKFLSQFWLKSFWINGFKIVNHLIKRVLFLKCEFSHDFIHRYSRIFFLTLELIPFLIKIDLVFYLISQLILSILNQILNKFHGVLILREFTKRVMSVEKQHITCRALTPNRVSKLSFAIIGVEGVFITKHLAHTKEIEVELRLDKFVLCLSRLIKDCFEVN